MIKALFSSKPTGSKQFKRVDKCTLGWQPINDLYQRELERVSQNLTRMVPHLREAHCLRDVWTKLNVHPAKVSGLCYSLHLVCMNFSVFSFSF